MSPKRIALFKNRSCNYKNRLVTLKSAITYLLSKRDDGIGVDSIYKCVFCGYYHIGHASKTKTRKNNRQIIKHFIKERRKLALSDNHSM
jgi:hypothetical protein